MCTISTMTLVEAIQCLQHLTSETEDNRSAAALTILTALQHMASKWRYRLPTKHDAEDIVSQVLVRLCQGLPSTTHFADEDSAKKYLRACVKYAARRLLSGGESKWRSAAEVDVEACPTDLPDGRYERKRAQQHLLCYLAPLIDFTGQALSPRRREIFQASIDDLLSRIRADGAVSTPALCKLRDISRDNLYQRHRRAREALLDALTSFCRAHGVPGDAKLLMEDFICRLKR